MDTVLEAGGNGHCPRGFGSGGLPVLVGAVLLELANDGINLVQGSGLKA